MKPRHFFKTHFKQKINEYEFEKISQTTPYIELNINGDSYFLNTVEYTDCTFHIYSKNKPLTGNDYAKMKDDLLHYAPGNLA